MEDLSNHVAEISDTSGGRERKALFPRPRRADPETVAYLQSLEDKINEKVKEVQTHGKRTNLDKDKNLANMVEESDEEEEDLEDEMTLMVNNIIEEIKMKAASIAEDRNASSIFEKLIFLCNRKQLLIIFESLSTYIVSLSINRYSSHVLETILSMCGPFVDEEMDRLSENDLDTIGNESNAVDNNLEKYLYLLILKAADEMFNFFNEISSHLCGNHVIRAIIHVLNGRPILAKSRGKNSKHRHSIQTQTHIINTNKTLNDSSTGDMKYKVPPEFIAFFEDKIIQIFLDPEKMELSSVHRFIIDANSGPVMICILEILGKQNLKNIIWQLMERILSWPQESEREYLKAEKNQRFKDIVYAMAGDIVGSHFLETIINLLADKAAHILHLNCLAGSYEEYILHSTSNYVVQRILHHMNDDTLFLEACSEILPLTDKLMSSNRYGVLWQLTETSRRLYNKHGSKIIKVTDLSRISLSIIESSMNHFKIPLSKKKKKLSEMESTSEQSGEVHPIHRSHMQYSHLICKHLIGLSIKKDLDSEQPIGSVSGEGMDHQIIPLKGRLLHLNVPGVHIVSNLLQYPSEISQFYEMGMSFVPTEDYIRMCKDNIASRCLIEILMSKKNHYGPTSSNGSPNSILREHYFDFMNQFKNSLGTLCVHPVAHHVLLKYYESYASIEDKENITKELLRSERFILDSKYGKNIYFKTRASLYKQDIEQWKIAIKAQKNKQEVLMDILSVVQNDTKKSENNEIDSLTLSVNNGTENKRKKDKKRKRSQETSNSTIKLKDTRSSDSETDSEDGSKDFSRKSSLTDVTMRKSEVKNSYVDDKPSSKRTKIKYSVPAPVVSGTDTDIDTDTEKRVDSVAMDGGMLKEEKKNHEKEGKKKKKEKSSSKHKKKEIKEYLGKDVTKIRKSKVAMLQTMGGVNGLMSKGQLKQLVGNLEQEYNQRKK